MSTKYMAAYALAGLASAKPTKEDVSKIIKAVGADVDENELDFAFECIAGRTTNELIVEGNRKIANAAVSAVPTSASSAPAAAAAGAGGKPAAAAKEEKKEEEEEDGMFDLFG